MGRKRRENGKVKGKPENGKEKRVKIRKEGRRGEAEKGNM